MIAVGAAGVSKDMTWMLEPMRNNVMAFFMRTPGLENVPKIVS
jgi:hypothetical protein